MDYQAGLRIKPGTKQSTVKVPGTRYGYPYPVPVQYILHTNPSASGGPVVVRGPLVISTGTRALPILSKSRSAISQGHGFESCRSIISRTHTHHNQSKLRCEKSSPIQGYGTLPSALNNMGNAHSIKLT